MTYIPVIKKKYQTLYQFLKRVHFQGKVWTTKPKKLWKQQGDTDRNILFVPLTLSVYSEFVLNQTQVEISLFPASSQKGLSLIVLRSTSHCNPSLFPSSRFLHPQLGETGLVLSPIALPILLALPFTPLVRTYVDELDLVSFILIRYRSQRCTSSSRFIRLDNRYVFWSSLLRTNGIAQQYFHCSGNGRKLNNFTWSSSTGLNFSFLRYKYFFSTITCKKHVHVFPITICKNIQICFLNYNLQKNIQICFLNLHFPRWEICTSRHSAICPCLVTFLVLSWKQIVFSGIQILFISLSRVLVQRRGTKLMMPSYKELLWGVVCLLSQ